MRRPLSLSLKFVAAALLSVASGCDLFTSPDTPDVRLTMASATHPRGFNVAVNVENRSDRTLYVHHGCNAGLQRLSAGRWEMAYPLPGCPPLLFASAGMATSDWTVEPPVAIGSAESEELQWYVPSDAPAGTYRVRVVLSDSESGSGESFGYVSPQFSVVEPVILFK